MVKYRSAIKTQKVPELSIGANRDHLGSNSPSACAYIREYLCHTESGDISKD